MTLKKIPDFPDYLIDESGNIFSTITNKYIKQRIDKKRVIINLYVDGLCLRRGVGRLVFIAFKGYEPEIVRHKDGNFKNNHLSNLYELSMYNHLSSLGNHDYFNVRTRKIYSVNIENLKVEQVTLKYRTKLYDRVNKCLNFKTFCSGKKLYFYEGNKEILISILKNEVKHYKQCIIYDCAKYNKREHYIRQLANYLMYIKILESVKEQ